MKIPSAPKYPKSRPVVYKPSWKQSNKGKKWGKVTFPPIKINSNDGKL